MTYIEEPAAQDAALEQFRGAYAQVWAYRVSLKRLALRLSRPGTWMEDDLWLVVAGAEHMAGPFSWKDAEVAIQATSAEGRRFGSSRIVDDKAGFALLGSVPAMLRARVDEFDRVFLGGDSTVG